MREILFRGKRKDNGEWIEGYRCNCIRDINGEKKYPAIQQTNDNSLYFREILPETVGQYTGLTDKNGRKIFEGDIVSLTKYSDLIYKVVYDNCRYELHNANETCCYVLSIYKSKDIEVIGNIHDNRELLEKAENP